MPRYFTNTKLNNSLVKQFASCISQGATIKSACKECGISPNTFYSWLKKGETVGNGLYSAFNREIKRASEKYAEARLEGMRQYEKGGGIPYMPPQRYNFNFIQESP
jgi:transposase